MKFGQLTREQFFFKNHVENKAGTLVPDLRARFNKITQVNFSEEKLTFFGKFFLLFFFFFSFFFFELVVFLICCQSLWL